MYQGFVIIYSNYIYILLINRVTHVSNPPIYYLLLAYNFLTYKFRLFLNEIMTLPIISPSNWGTLITLAGK